MAEERIWDVAILGAGPAGLTAALYAGRAMLSVCIVEQMASGGQVANTSIVENYPGFPQGIDGIELSRLFEQHASAWNPQWIYEEIKQVVKENEEFLITTASQVVRARTVIAATGSRPRLLGVPGEKELRGRGVSYCAICDGAFFRDKKVAVIGGGDSAIEEAVFLTKYASQVIIVHRRDELRATKHVQDLAFSNDKIVFEWSHVVDSILGEDKVEGVRLRSTKTGETKELAVDGVFIYIGMIPNTSFLKEMVETDQSGYIVAGEDTVTSCPGLFAAGDARKKPLRQIVTATADGAVAAMAAQSYLNS